MPAPTLVFDLDGTLVDTAGDLAVALNAILASEGLPAVPLAEARAMTGHGARVMLARALTAAGLNPEAERLDNLTAAFIDHYSAHIADNSVPFPDVAATLDRLTAAGWALAICTNKLESLSRLLLTKLELGHRFAAIAGQDTFGVRKPDPRHLTETIRLAGGDPGDAIFVGDSSIDVETARAANVPVIFATFGYGPTPDPVPDVTIASFGELFDRVAALRAQPRSRQAR